MRKVLVLFIVLLAGCGGETDEAPSSGAGVLDDPGPIHVHGLGVNPADGDLYIATHTGLFRVADDQRRAERIGESYQDTMGFTVLGPDRFLGSGHPDGRDAQRGAPPFLGLIESTNAGETWQSLSLRGDADFHVLESAGDVVYGFGTDFDSREEQLLVSRDGADWQEREVPESLISLAIHPRNSDRAIASGATATYATTDSGRSWRFLDAGPGFLAWPAEDRLYRIAPTGAVELSADAGRTWRRRGDAGAEIAAFTAEGADELYAALHDGRIMLSEDGGREWNVRSAP